MKIRLLGLIVFALVTFMGIAQNKIINEVAPQVGIYEHLDTIVSSDIYLVNKDSTLVQLSSLIDKPTVFCFIYFNCPGLCSPLLGGVADVIDKTDLVLGEDYQVITISMNYDDQPTLGQKKKANYVKSFTKDIDDSAWIWLTGDSLNVAKVTDNFGFKFMREGKEFIHAAAIMVTSPEAKVTRYLHGTYFLPFSLKMAIVEASQGISGPTINKVLEFCFSYDAAGKQYVFNITKISGSIIIGMALLLLLVLIFKKKKNNI
ncbi:MAG: SCO family protein [Bacteroidales bacterium]|nr:SCO family protein [Bacteroidales bacterium]